MRISGTTIERDISFQARQAEKTGEIQAGTQETAPQSESEFRRTFSASLSALTQHPTVRNAAVTISPEGLKAMQEDPEYREKVIALIQRDIGSSYAPRDASVSIRIGETLDDYRADSWSVGYDDEYYARSSDSFWRRDREDKSTNEDYLAAFARRMRDARILEQRRMDRLERADLSERQRTAALYESHMAEPASASLLEGVDG